MRELTFNEINEVNGAWNPAYRYAITEKTLNYGAAGTLANMILNGVTVAVGWQGFLIGAGVGFGLAVASILVHELGLD